jgi:hypothetical protein
MRYVMERTLQHKLASARRSLSQEQEEYMISRSLSVAVLSALCLAGRTSHAQGWVKMPNGSLAYQADYLTTGVFTCGNPRYILGTCLSLGNSVVVSNARSSVTVTFNPVSSTMLAPSSHRNTITLGSLQTSFTGAGPNEFPRLYTTAARLFYLGVSITTTSPITSTGGLRWSFATRPQGLVALSGWQSTTRLGVAPPPAPATYTGIPVGGINYPVLNTVDEIEQIHARVSVTPEPATIALMGTGLLGVFGIARRRMRRAE